MRMSLKPDPEERHLPVQGRLRIRNPAGGPIVESASYSATRWWPPVLASSGALWSQPQRAM